MGDIRVSFDMLSLTVLLSTQTCIQVLIKVLYSWELMMFGDGLTLCERLSQCCVCTHCHVTFKVLL